MASVEHRNPNLEAKRLERLRIAEAENVLRGRRKVKKDNSEVIAETYAHWDARKLIGKEEELQSLIRACKHTKLFDHGHTYLVALGRLVSHSKDWIRTPQTWVCRSKSPRRQFQSLAFHLFAKYQVPEFLYSAWFERRQRIDTSVWFVLLSQGTSVRKLPNLPIVPTKAMAHLFTKVPADISVNSAFRWAQVVSLGGEDRLARSIIAVPLLAGFFAFPDINTFWDAVIRFFVANPMIDHSQIGPIVDYIQNQKYERGLNGAPPPHPNFCMKGRTVESLMTQMAGWHRELGYNKKSFVQWESCGIPGGEYEEGVTGKKVHIIRELLNSNQLQEEGRAMSHCVASYVTSCQNGRSAIYSITTRDGSSVAHRLTIEVRLDSKQIVQARGRFNARPTDLDKRILRLWSAKSGVSLSSHL
jgi:hypothetical protein